MDSIQAEVLNILSGLFPVMGVLFALMLIFPIIRLSRSFFDTVTYHHDEEKNKGVSLSEDPYSHLPYIDDKGVVHPPKNPKVDLVKKPIINNNTAIIKDSAATKPTYYVTNNHYHNSSNDNTGDLLKDVAAAVLVETVVENIVDDFIFHNEN